MLTYLMDLFLSLLSYTGRTWHYLLWCLFGVILLIIGKLCKIFGLMIFLSLRGCHSRKFNLVIDMFCLIKDNLHCSGGLDCCNRLCLGHRYFIRLTCFRYAHVQNSILQVCLSNFVWSLLVVLDMNTCSYNFQINFILFFLSN